MYWLGVLNLIILRQPRETLTQHQLQVKSIRRALDLAHGSGIAVPNASLLFAVPG